MGGFDASKGGPLRVVARRVFVPACDLSPQARLVALAIAERMNPHGVAWPGYGDLARRTGLARSTVGKALAELCDGPAPVFARTRRGRGTAYAIVSDPQAFAERRDEARAAWNAKQADASGYRLHTTRERDPLTSPPHGLEDRAETGSGGFEGVFDESERPVRHTDSTSPPHGLVPVRHTDWKTPREESQGRDTPLPPTGGLTTAPKDGAAAVGGDGPLTPNPGNGDRSADRDAAAEALATLRAMLEHPTAESHRERSRA